MPKKKTNIKVDKGSFKRSPGDDLDLLDTDEPKESDYFSSKEDEFHHSGVQTGELSLDELISIIRANVHDVLLKHELISREFQDENETDLMTSYASARDREHLRDAGVESVNEQTLLRFKILSGIKAS